MIIKNENSIDGQGWCDKHKVTFHMSSGREGGCQQCWAEREPKFELSLNKKNKVKIKRLKEKYAKGGQT